MSRKTILAPGEYYHIYNRGTDKRKVFMTQQDYKRFLALLYVCNGTNPVSINFRGSTSEIFGWDRGKSLVKMCAYCLMPNHFHILVQETENGGISKFMQKLITGYTMYFNKIRERSGSLFQGRFRASHIDNDKYFSYIVSYIHLNPIKIIEPEWKESGIKNKKKSEVFLDKYTYSSFLDYCGIKRLENAIISQDSLPNYSSSPNYFKTAVREWLNFTEATEVQPR
jgi:putative transposase